MPYRRNTWSGAVAVVACLLLAAASAASSRTAAGAWTTWGGSVNRAGYVGTTVTRVSRNFVLPLEGRMTGQVLASGGSFFAATSAGEVVSFTAAGYVRWRVQLGQGSSPCTQLDGYGVTGTGVIDVARGALFVADAFGRLHALSLATGAELPGWPVSVFTDSDKQLVWGGLTLVGNAVYVPTASYCDSPSLGGVYRVDLGTRAVTRWISVPPGLGGGGGVWGWGGMAYSAREKALFAVTANAFSGGTNTGSAFSESAGNGEHLVELSPSLAVTAANHPSDLTKPLDLDFVGSPVIVDRAGCGELVVGADKDDELYAWRASGIAAGPLWSVQLQPFDADDPMLSQLAFSPATSSVYAVTGTQLVRVSIAADCSPTVAWKQPLGTKSLNGSPTITGNTVWFTLSGTPALVAYDATSGRRVFSVPLGGPTLTAPTFVNGQLIVGTFTGLVQAFSVGAPPAATGNQPPPKSIAADTSWLDAKHGWLSRASGVYATDDAGRTWKRIYPSPALAVLRLTPTAGVIEVGRNPIACMCSTRKLWTTDAGRTWHQTVLVGDNFTGAGRNVYWWLGGTLHALANFPGKATKTRIAANLANGTIVDAEAVPGGVAALVSNRVNGLGWDTNPRVVLIRAGKTQTVTLPAQSGDILAQNLVAHWPRLTVAGADYASLPVKPASWVSNDGGATWSAG